MAKAAVVVSFLGMIVLNGLSATGLFGESIGKISDDHPTYVTPDGKTFAIWAVIYTLQLLLVVAQCCAGPEAEQLLSQRCPLTGLEVRWRIVLAFSLNAIWLPIYVTLRFTVAFVIIVIYLGALISVYTALNSKTVSTIGQLLTLAAPIATNASWIVVATSANLFTVLGEYGWTDQYGVAGTPLAAMVVVIIVIGIACFAAFVQFDAAWAGVAAWALAGLSRMQSVPDPEKFPVLALSPGLARAANVGSIATAVTAVLAAGLWLYRAQQPKEAPHTLMSCA